MISPQMVREMWAMYADGVTQDKIALYFNIHRNSVIIYMREARELVAQGRYDADPLLELQRLD